jgi:hypothetical protein
MIPSPITWFTVPFVEVDRFHHQLEYGVEDLARLLGIAVGEQLHRALEVSEEHRDLFALTFEGGFRDEDLLREMFGCVGLRSAEPGRGCVAGPRL